MGDGCPGSGLLVRIAILTRFYTGPNGTKGVPNCCGIDLLGVKLKNQLLRDLHWLVAKTKIRFILSWDEIV